MQTKGMEEGTVTVGRTPIEPPRQQILGGPAVPDGVRQRRAENGYI